MRGEFQSPYESNNASILPPWLINIVFYYVVPGWISVFSELGTQCSTVFVAVGVVVEKSDLGSLIGDLLLSLCKFSGSSLCSCRSDVSLTCD